MSYYCEHRTFADTCKSCEIDRLKAELALCKEAEEGSHKNALYWNGIAEKAEAELEKVTEERNKTEAAWLRDRAERDALRDRLDKIVQIAALDAVKEKP